MGNRLTKQAFANWCEKQPADKEYDYWCNECAFGQYLAAVGIPFASIGCEIWRSADGKEHNLPAGISYPLGNAPRTFGALAARLREGAAS